MSYEVEQKFRVADLSAVSGQLTDLGATFQGECRQCDIYYAHPQRDFAATDEALRLRTMGEQNYFTYKGPRHDSEVKTRREIELRLDDDEPGLRQGAEFLTSLGFTEVAEVCKQRQHYQLHRAGCSVAILLDQVEQVGTFVELELIVPTEAEIPAAQATIAALAEELALGPLERRSYLKMLLEAGGN